MSSRGQKAIVDNPAPPGTRAIGDRGLRSKASRALRVPSTVVPSEHNVLMNPGHPRFEEVLIEGPFDPELDERLTSE